MYVSIMRFRMISRLLLLPLIAVILIGPRTAAGKTGKTEWSAVRGIEAGKKIRIKLYNDEAPDGPRRFNGSFSAASADSVTIVLSDGVTRTFEKRAVRRMSVKRPFFNRPAAWVVTGMAAGLAQLLIYGLPDLALLGGDTVSRAEASARSLAFIVVPAWAVATLALPWKTVYNVPAKHGDAVRSAANGGGVN